MTEALVRPHKPDENEVRKLGEVALLGLTDAYTALVADNDLSAIFEGVDGETLSPVIEALGTFDDVMTADMARLMRGVVGGTATMKLDPHRPAETMPLPAVHNVPPPVHTSTICIRPVVMGKVVPSPHRLFTDATEEGDVRTERAELTLPPYKGNQITIAAVTATVQLQPGIEDITQTVRVARIAAGNYLLTDDVAGEEEDQSTKPLPESLIEGTTQSERDAPFRPKPYKTIVAMQEGLVSTLGGEELQQWSPISAQIVAGRLNEARVIASAALRALSS